MSVRYQIIFLLLVVNLAHAQSTVYTIETVPNVKVDSNNLVSNPDGILSPETVRRMDSQLKALEESTTAQVAVVAINSIGDQDIFNFAQELFTKWGIGQKSNDNGLLILLVLDQRTVRFHTGKGLEGILPDIVCKRIQEQDMVPLFKEGKNNEAMSAGVDHILRVLKDPIYADEILAKELRAYSGWEIFFPATLGIGLVTLLIMLVVNNRKFTDSKKPLSTPYAEMRMSRVGWLTEFGIVPAAILLVFHFSPMISPILECLAALYGYFIFTLLVKRMRMRSVVNRLIEKEKYKRVFDFFEDYRVGWLLYGILFPLPFLPHYFMYRNRMKYYRNHPRACENCGKPARKLDEQTDDQYLSKEKAFEEGLQSADYDVWLCDACGTYFELVYQNRFSKYSPCPKCKTKAWYQKSNRTLVSPTESSTGRGEKTFECKYCNHTVSTTYTIARLSSSSGSSSSGGSSGGSFGGGSSGGGGASSSW
jgi:uncharacterized protein